MVILLNCSFYTFYNSYKNSDTENHLWFALPSFKSSEGLEQRHSTTGCALLAATREEGMSHHAKGNSQCHIHWEQFGIRWWSSFDSLKYQGRFGRLNGSLWLEKTTDGIQTYMSPPVRAAAWHVKCVWLDGSCTKTLQDYRHSRKWFSTVMTILYRLYCFWM